MRKESEGEVDVLAALHMATLSTCKRNRANEDMYKSLNLKQNTVGPTKIIKMTKLFCDVVTFRDLKLLE